MEIVIYVPYSRVIKIFGDYKIKSIIFTGLSKTFSRVFNQLVGYYHVTYPGYTYNADDVCENERTLKNAVLAEGKVKQYAGT
jgi:uncharacterized protein (UPF0297 family)